MLHAVQMPLFSTKGQGGMVRKRRHLSEVELCVLLCRNALYLEKGSVGTGVTFATLMAKYAPFAVESAEETKVRFGCSLRDLSMGARETSS
jgi:hypothetical protein